MADHRVIIEGVYADPVYPGNSTNPLPVILTPNPQIDGTYTASVANVAGAATPLTVMTIFNPVESGKTVVIGGVFISTVAAAGTAATQPMRLYRLGTAPTGGVVMTSAEIFKLNTSNPNPVSIIRTGNPTVTLLAAGSNTPPPVTTGAGGGQFVHEIEPPAGQPFLLAPGEGIAVHNTAGDTAQRWNVSIAWAEI